MKKLFLLVMLVGLGLTLNAQAGYQTFTDIVTMGAQTKYLTATVKCAYVGQISFEGILDGRAASDDVVVILQGSNDNFATTKLVAIDTIPTYSSTTATPFYMTDIPADFLYYRLKCIGAITDTVDIKNVIFIYKR
jgi:hypothetical protein